MASRISCTSSSLIRIQLSIFCCLALSSAALAEPLQGGINLIQKYPSLIRQSAEKPGFDWDKEQSRPINELSPCRCCAYLTWNWHVNLSNAENESTWNDLFTAAAPLGLQGQLQTRKQQEHQLATLKEQLAKARTDEETRALEAQERALKQQILSTQKSIRAVLQQHCIQNDSGPGEIFSDPPQGYNPRSGKPLRGSIEGTGFDAGTKVFDPGVLKSQLIDTGICRCVRIPWKQWQDNLHSFVFDGLGDYLSKLPVGTDIVVHTTIKADGTIDRFGTYGDEVSGLSLGSGQMIANAVLKNLEKHPSLLVFPEPQIRQVHPELKRSLQYTLKWTHLQGLPFQSKQIASRDLDEEVILQPGEQNPIISLPCQRQVPPTSITPPPFAPNVIPPQRTAPAYSPPKRFIDADQFRYQKKKFAN